jgi:RND superfamily putative drug exporter
MARVREETLMHGTRQGTIRSLAVTGAVITSFVKVLGAKGAAVAGIRLYEAHISPDS